MNCVNKELIIKLLSKNTLFSELETSELEIIIEMAHFKSIQKKQIIFHKGEEGGQLYLLMTGVVQISSMSDQGKEIILDLLKSGEVFGEISLFDEMDRSATATTLEYSDLLIIKRKDFIPFLEKNPQVAIKMLTGLSKRLRQTNITLEDMLFKTLPSRLAKKLIELSDNYGEELPNGELRISLSLSHTQLGNMVDSSRESICRQLGVWQVDDVIRVDHGYIIIQNLDQLESLL